MVFLSRSKERMFSLTGENITFTFCGKKALYCTCWYTFMYNDISLRYMHWVSFLLPDCDVCWLLFYETSDFVTVSISTATSMLCNQLITMAMNLLWYSRTWNAIFCVCMCVYMHKLALIIRKISSYYKTRNDRYVTPS